MQEENMSVYNRNTPDLPENYFLPAGSTKKENINLLKISFTITNCTSTSLTPHIFPQSHIVGHNYQSFDNNYDSIYMLEKKRLHGILNVSLMGGEMS